MALTNQSQSDAKFVMEEKKEKKKKKKGRNGFSIIMDFSYNF